MRHALQKGWREDLLGQLLELYLLLDKPRSAWTLGEAAWEAGMESVALAERLVEIYTQYGGASEQPALERLSSYLQKERQAEEPPAKDPKPEVAADPVAEDPKPEADDPVVEEPKPEVAADPATEESKTEVAAGPVAEESKPEAADPETEVTGDSKLEAAGDKRASKAKGEGKKKKKKRGNR